MALELKKATQVSLRSLGLDERWLQDRISEDSSLLDRQLRHADEHHHGRVAGGAVRAPWAVVPMKCVDVASCIGPRPERAAPASKDGLHRG
jgi:hypothetical protein